MAKANLGELPGLTAAGALMIDYSLTVSVSVAAGVAALTSAMPALYRHRAGPLSSTPQPEPWPLDGRLVESPEPDLVALWFVEASCLRRRPHA